MYKYKIPLKIVTDAFCCEGHEHSLTHSHKVCKILSGRIFVKLLEN